MPIVKMGLTPSIRALPMTTESDPYTNPEEFEPVTTEHNEVVIVFDNMPEARAFFNDVLKDGSVLPEQPFAAGLRRLTLEQSDPVVVMVVFAREKYAANYLLQQSEGKYKGDVKRFITVRKGGDLSEGETLSLKTLNFMAGR